MEAWLFERHGVHTATWGKRSKVEITLTCAGYDEVGLSSLSLLGGQCELKLDPNCGGLQREDED